MSKKNVLKFFVGSILIILSVLSAGYAYYMYQRNVEMNEKLTVISKELDEYELKLKNTGFKKDIQLEKLVQKAKKEYGEDEQDRVEGYLWIDRKESKYIITLGALNDVLPGEILTVYDGKRKIGQVEVKTSFDVISYVEFTDESITLNSNDYYRVVKE